MAKLLRLPELAESVVEGEIVGWLKKEGDFIKKNEPLVEVMTEKVNVEIPSPYEGFLVKIIAKEGDVIPVNAPMAIFSEPDEDPSKIDIDEILTGEPIPVTRKIGEERVEEKKKEAEVPSQLSEGKVPITPAARKLARELGIDIEAIPIKGKRRIQKKDVLEYAESLKATQRVEPKEVEPLKKVPLKGIRREISKRLRESKDRAVHTLHVDEADLTELVNLRAKAKKIAELEGVQLTYLPFIVKAVVLALKKHPYLNSTFDDEKGEILVHSTYNIGIATATEEGLIVPVIKNVESKTLIEIAKEIADLSERARKGTLALDEVTGGTFSITNIGSIGGLFSFPIINYPQVAILGVHSIKKRPVVNENGEIVVRDMTYMSLSFDHRVVDGAEAARFTKDLIEILENPESLLLFG